MLKDRLLKLLPKPEKLRENRTLKPVAHLLQRKELWQINRRSVSSAVFVGKVGPTGRLACATRSKKFETCRLNMSAP